MNTVKLLEDQPIETEFSAPATTRYRIPEVFLIGSAKSATTSLANLLARHPNVALGQVKEPNFFSHKARFERGFDWYSSLFSKVGPNQLALDASTGYTRWPQNPGTAARIHACAPDAKLIYLMRHPVDRAYSHFVHRWTKECHPGKPFSQSFADYVQLDPMCLDSSNYRAQIEDYLDYFPSESLLCLFTEDVKRDPTTVLQEVCQFLGIDDAARHFDSVTRRDNRAQDYLEGRVRVMLTDKIKSIPIVKPLLPLIPKSIREVAYAVLRRSNVGNRTQQEFTPPPMPTEVRKRMIEHFAESNAWVANFTARDLSHWNR